MIQIEINGNLVYTKSSTNHKLKQNETGIVYGSEVIDHVTKNYTYTETDEIYEIINKENEEI